MSRSNLLNQTALLGTLYDWPRGGVTPDGQVFAVTHSGYQRQPINQLNKRVNGIYPPGGDWIAWQRTKQNVPSNVFTTMRPGFGRAYQGSYFLQSPVNSPIPHTDILYTVGGFDAIVSTLEGLGAEGYARARPAKPDFSFATSMLELKDVPSMLKQSIYLFINRVIASRTVLAYSFSKGHFFNKITKTRLSHTAEWYLALNFGWLPILRDITRFMEATAKQDATLRQLLRDEGRPIVRRRVIHENVRIPDSLYIHENFVSNPSYGIQPQHVTQCYPNGSIRREFRYSITSKVEFVAKFRYYLPDGPRDFPWEARLRRRMLGARVTPSVAWNLMPWTFLVDYFSTLGHAVSNLGPGIEDQLITEYCYITYREDYVYSESHQVDTWASGSDTNKGKATVIQASRLRMRVSADPFAFRFTGLTPSVKQSAILVALAVK